MKLRKINAGISLLCTGLLLNHTAVHAIWMLTHGRLPKITTNSYRIVPWVLVVLMLAHAAISIVLAVLGHKGSIKGRYNGYAKLNRVTYIQRFSGIALLLFSALHIAGAAGFMTPPPFIHAAVSAVFFTIALAHAAISTGKAFITLGIGNAAFIKAADIVIKIVCAAALIAAITGFYLYRV